MTYRRHKRCGQLIHVDDLAEHAETCTGVDVDNTQGGPEGAQPSDLPAVSTNDLRRLGSLLTGAADALDSAPVVMEEVAHSSRRVLTKLGDTLRGEAAETLFNIAMRLRDREADGE